MTTPSAQPKPNWPKWAREIALLWNARGHSLFILHGNIFDLYPLGENKGYGSLKAILANRIFPDRRMMMFYDIADGLTFASREMQKEFLEWLEVYYDTCSAQTRARFGGDPPKEFRDLMPVLRQFINQTRDEPPKNGKQGISLLIDYPEKIVPNTTDAGASGEERLAEVALLKFASTNRGKDVGIFLVAESILDLGDALARSPYVAQTRIDLPDMDERTAFLNDPAAAAIPAGGPLSVDEIARRTAGLTLGRIQNLLAQCAESNTPVSGPAIAQGKKKLIEEYCQGLITFKEPSPKKKLANVANHTAAKQKLTEIAWLIANGKNEVLERGILVPGRIGVGKTYLIDCFASECGLPVVELGNFRSKWVGDTEKQLSKVLITIRALGPLVVTVDEADAVFGGGRESGGEDGGVSSRVFAALAAHIGDSELRGREIWIAMTSRPDLLAIDMKRQGRFGLCIPLFPTQSPNEVLSLFETIAATKGIPLGKPEKEKIVSLLGSKPLTGSDADAILTRAQERAVLARRESQPEDFVAAVENFIDALDPQLLAIQELAGVLACSDKRYLPAQYRDADRQTLRDTFEALKK
ncbi:MAG: AAA family ATPase [Terrimicrobiaceae bacterium]